MGRMLRGSVILLVIIGAIVWALTPPIQPTVAKDPPARLIGDGATDNSAVIEAMLRTDGTVSFPRGVFRITRTIVIKLDEVGPTALSAAGNTTLLMDGAGPALHFIGNHGGTAAPATVKPEIWKKERTPQVTGLEIVGGHAEADGILAEGTMQLSLDRVVIRECRDAVRLAKRNRNVMITGSHIYNNRGHGVFLDHVNLHQINITGCHISYCKRGGVVSRGGEVRNLQIGNCDIEGNMGPDLPETANVLLDSTGGSIAEVAITGCTIQHESKSAGSANVRIRGGGVGGLKNVPGRTKEGHVTITGNVFSDVRINVDLQDTRGVVVSGNTFWMGYDYNLRLQNCEHVVIGPNIMERNPRYDYGDAVSTKNALLFQDCADLTITGLHVHDARGSPAAVRFEKCRRINMSACTLIDCEGTSLSWKDVSASRLSNCLIRSARKDSRSLTIDGGSGNAVIANSLDQLPQWIDSKDRDQFTVLP